MGVIPFENNTHDSLHIYYIPRPSTNYMLEMTREPFILNHGSYGMSSWQEKNSFVVSCSQHYPPACIMVMFVWLVVRPAMKEEWKSVSVTPGYQSVILVGMCWAQQWSVDN